jgi:hypothetical protein
MKKIEISKMEKTVAGLKCIYVGAAAALSLNPAGIATWFTTNLYSEVKRCWNS